MTGITGMHDSVDVLYRDSLSHPGSTAFALCDFDGYSSVTFEPVPADDARSEMWYYWDSLHFKANDSASRATRRPSPPPIFTTGRDPGFAVGQLAHLAAARSSEGVMP